MVVNMFNPNDYELSTITRLPSEGIYENLLGKFDKNNIHELLKDYKQESMSAMRDAVFITYREKNFNSVLIVAYVRKGFVNKKINSAVEVWKSRAGFGSNMDG